MSENSRGDAPPADLADVVPVVVHEVRAPLTVLLGYLDILRRPLPEKERDAALRAARQAVHRMDDLLEDLLTASGVEDIFNPKEAVPLRADDLARDAAAAFGPIADREISVIAECSPVVLGEERRLLQALDNLITNAATYSPEGTTVRISVECPADTALIAVEDEGPGIPSEERERVFEPYTRLHGPNGAGRPGLGLGLYVVRAIARGHGGEARAEEPTSGAGARLVIELPVVACD